MRSAEELTLVVGGALRLVSVVLDIVARSRVEPTSSREQMETSGEQRFGRDSFHPRSKA
jgi:hypothetical protein